MSEGFTVVGREAIALYDLLGFRATLGLEIRTGMMLRPGYSLIQAAILRGYVPEGTRTKRKAYEAIDALIVSIGGTSRPLDKTGGAS